jgi:hypothetical protein
MCLSRKCLDQKIRERFLLPWVLLFVKKAMIVKTFLKPVTILGIRKEITCLCQGFYKEQKTKIIYKDWRVN